jgi:predicted DNA-binding transcriptional regulator AlpA
MNDDFITIDQACQIIGGTRPVSRPTLYRGIKSGLYPPVIHPSPGISRIRKSALVAAIESRISEAETSR